MRKIMTSVSTRTIVAGWTWLCVALTIAGCQPAPGKDVTARKPYADVIGAKYIVVADDLYAYGVYESLNHRTLSYIELVPLMIGGPEFAFSRPIRNGTVITILSAWEESMVFQTRAYYLVRVENSDVDVGTPVRLELSRGNEGIGADLNPAVYRRLAKTN